MIIVPYTFIRPDDRKFSQATKKLDILVHTLHKQFIISIAFVNTLYFNN